MPDINHDRYKQEVITVIDNYLERRTSSTHTSEWALKLFVSRDFERFPKRMRYAICLILDLHDEGKPWCPTPEELKNCKSILLDESVPLPPFVEVKLKSRTTRGARKELEDIVRKRLESKKKNGSGKSDRGDTNESRHEIAARRDSR